MTLTLQLYFQMYNSIKEVGRKRKNSEVNNHGGKAIMCDVGQRTWADLNDISLSQ